MSIVSADLQQPPFKYIVAESYLAAPSWDGANEVTEQILRTPAGKRVVGILPSIRRIGATYQTSEVSAQRRTDVWLDLSHFEHRSINEQEVTDTIRALENICIVYDPIVEKKVKREAISFRRLDQVDATMQAQAELRRRIIFNWSGRGTTSSEISSNLMRFATSSVSFILRDLREEDLKSYKVVDDNPDDEMVGTWISFDSQRKQRRIKRIMNIYAEAVGQYNLIQLMHFINELDPRKKVAVLKMGNYFHPEESMQQHFRRIGRNDGSAALDLRYALTLLAQANENKVNNDPIDIAQMVDESERLVLGMRGKPQKGEQITQLRKEPQEEPGESVKPGKYRTSEWFVRNNGARALLADEWDVISEKLLPLLTESEQKIIRLAMSRIDNKFLYTYEEISDKCGLSTGRVRNIVYEANKIRQNSYSREAIKRIRDKKPKKIKAVPVKKEGYRTHSQTLPGNSSRVQLIESGAADDLAFISSLSKTEAIVLQHAVAYLPSGALLSNKEIASQALIAPESVPVVLSRINEKRRNSNNRPVDTNGNMIDKKGIHFKLISIANSITDDMLACLNDKERNIYNISLSQDEFGHFPSLTTIKELSGISRIDIILKEIYAKLTKQYATI